MSRSLTTAVLPALIVTAALTLAGCVAGADVTDNPPAGENRPDTEQAENVDEPAEEAPTNPIFGESYEWSNGLVVTVSEPVEFTPSEYAATGGTFDTFLKFDITIVNDSDENYDPSMFYDTLQSGNAEAESVFDSDSGLSGSPSTTLLSGREVAFSVGYGVMDPGDLVMEVAPGFEYESTVWVSK